MSPLLLSTLLHNMSR